MHKTGAVVSLPFWKPAHLTVHLYSIFLTVNYAFNNVRYMSHKAKTSCYLNIFMHLQILKNALLPQTIRYKHDSAQYL